MRMVEKLAVDYRLDAKSRTGGDLSRIRFPDAVSNKNARADAAIPEEQRDSV